MFLQNYYYYFQKALSPEFCDKIIEQGKQQIIESATVADANLQKARKSGISGGARSYTKKNKMNKELSSEISGSLRLIGFSWINSLRFSENFSDFLRFLIFFSQIWRRFYEVASPQKIGHGRSFWEFLFFVRCNLQRTNNLKIQKFQGPVPICFCCLLLFTNYKML